jgi:hypothetical protein
VNNNEVTPEIQAVLDAAKVWVNSTGSGPTNDLISAVVAYERSQMPQPIEVLMSRWLDTTARVNPDGWACAYALNENPVGAPELWRCTITPHERVK